MKTTSKAGTGLGALAAIACVACCALPVLIAAGVLSGAAATFLAGKMPVIAIVLAVFAVLAFSLAARRRRRRAAGCGDPCGTQGGCGCAPTRV